MDEPSRTLSEIRSDTCNKILLMLGAIAVPGLGVIFARFLEQGWMWTMAMHSALLVLLIAVTVRRHRVSLTIRAATVITIPFVIGMGSVLASGRLSAALMFFVTSAVLAACFFKQRVAFGLIAAGFVMLSSVYIAFRTGLMTPQFTPLYDLSIVTWISIFAAFSFAGLAPVTAVYALYQALEAERVRANAAAEARTAFLANMSHELRTPMAGIIGMAELLKDDKLGPQRERLAENLIGASRNLMAVLNDLLDFAKFKTGKVPIEHIPFKLSDMVSDLCATFATRAKQKGLAFRVEFPHHFADDLVADSHRITQVLSNLIDNAVKFTADGAVTLTLDQVARRARGAQIPEGARGAQTPEGARGAQAPENAGAAQTAEGNGLTLVCTVTDTGIGVPPAQQEAIFEPFVQGDSSISRKYGGSGLGLAICRGLMEAMGGELTLSSRPGHGSTFTVTVPVEAGPKAAPAPPAGLTPRGAPARTLSLLAAEDDAAMRLILEIKMEQWGHAVTIVNDGLAALKAAAAGAYDCILMDMHMPIMNGADAVRAIRAAEDARGGPRVPVLAITADLIPERVRRFKEAGVDEIAGKPVNWDTVAAQIQKLTR